VATTGRDDTTGLTNGALDDASTPCILAGRDLFRSGFVCRATPSQSVRSSSLNTRLRCDDAGGEDGVVRFIGRDNNA
jgi:hypothetical protein